MVKVSEQDTVSNSNRKTQILKALERKPLSAREIQSQRNLPLPTIYRYLGGLEKDKFVVKDVGAYALTDRGRQLLEILDK